MSHASDMRLIQSKNVGYKIEIMKWSNRMDLLAVSNDKGMHTGISVYSNQYIYKISNL